MTKISISFLLILNSIFLFAKNDLEKTRQKFNKYKSVSYTLTAFYPNPDTEIVTKFKTFYIINNYNSNKFDFYSKTGTDEEIFKNENYTSINNEEKTFSQFEQKQNQEKLINTSRIVQYGPTFILKYNWKYENEVSINGLEHSHYSFIENIRKYGEKTIKTEFHIYISSKHLISKLERKNYIDDKLSQTVTFDYSEYNFSKKEIQFDSEPKRDYSLKYFERNEIKLLENSTQAPNFTAIDTENNEFSNRDLLGKNTLLLFSNTNCGASKEVSDLISNENFKLPSHLNLINFYTSDSNEIVKKYFKNKKSQFQIIANQKEIEKIFQISGYPVLYIVNDKGIITQSFYGLEPIENYLKSTQN